MDNKIKNCFTCISYVANYSYIATQLDCFLMVEPHIIGAISPPQCRLTHHLVWYALFIFTVCISKKNGLDSHTKLLVVWPDRPLFPFFVVVEKSVWSSSQSRLILSIVKHPGSINNVNVQNALKSEPCVHK